MYWMSRKNWTLINIEDKELIYNSVNHYNLAFILIVMAIMGPYIIQYSSLMNAIHNKGFFKEVKFNTFGRLKKLSLILAFTALGLIIMPILDIMLKLEAVLLVLTLPLQCKYGKT